MKKLLFAALIAVSMNSHAQLSAFINGKEIKAGATVSKKDLASLQISFKNPKKVTIISGAAVLYAQLLDADKKDIQMFFIQKEGYVAIEDFYKTSPATKKFKVFGEGGFPVRGNTLDWLLTSANGQEKEKTIQVKIGFYVVEEIGYQKYGEQVQLLQPLVFNVPIWDDKNLPLPFLGLTIDKTNVPGDVDTKQNGSIDDSRTDVGYRLRNKEIWYSAYTLSSDKFPGLNAKEVADDFIHAATLYANYNNLYDSKKPFKDYDIAKFTLPWDDINDMLESKWRISKMSYQEDKSLKKADLMTKFEEVTINGLKGYKFQSNTAEREHINAYKWTERGQFVIYILEHPTDPKRTLVVSSSVGNQKNTLEETDTVLKNFINGIKK
ncbi:MAG: hypothetical protein EOO50_00565 [Flavobacterium sp.]|uniref:hypothetical protein n=1 Tax=Flavobacterium sp. TaxID=239 RepID=UPI00120E3A14|nr:hypothetical protein [Flavobacterium sp.]RZJ68706.1 MAG: hypothetical protein EOO50_00565 [Flavobacterium sp.]